MRFNQRRAKLFLFSILMTFIILRLWLHLSPNSDFNVGSYNIHHLFTGLIFITFCGPILILFSGEGRLLDIASIGFGVGLSMALDEWVYLITTDGSNASYLVPISFWGGVVMITLSSAYVVGLILYGRRCYQIENN